MVTCSHTPQALVIRHLALDINSSGVYIMGNPTGFLEYTRQLPEDRAPDQRIGDWD